ncbi:DUF3943 domain-containing protein [Bacteroidales bacterium OttesenSCG-928-A17]|nr:DUF3943 domain-containing protein [Bacteroidales bacterium OttesenSCG-928-A17]
MKRKCLFLVLLLCWSFNISAYTQTTVLSQPDSTEIGHTPNKDWFKAGAITFGLNMGVWAYDRYIQKGHFAYIGWDTMKENFRKGFIWDNDYMGTNLFLHPYHGSLYFNAGRANGLNFWESGALALGGSAMWELFMECEYPSTNDIIATPLGGMALGEMLFRTSDLILDNRTTGSIRFGRELAAFIVSPTRGITRIINGDIKKKGTTSGRQFGIPETKVEISAGIRALELKTPVIDKGLGIAVNIDIEYGDIFEAETAKPYDYFYFRANLNGQGSQPFLSQLNICGRLYSTELVDNSKDFLSLGIYQHFDYYDSDTISDISSRVPYKFGTPASFGVGLVHKSKRSENWHLSSSFHSNLVLLGASLSDYYVVSDRNYNLASGFSWKCETNLSKKDRFNVSLRNEWYRMFTWKGYAPDIDWNTVNEKTLNAQGDHSQALLNVLSLRIDLKLKKRLYLTGIYYNYTRDTNYKYFDNVYSNTSEGRLMLTYRI